MSIAEQSGYGPGHPGLTDEFWEAAAKGVLVRPVCDLCGRSFFTPRVLCPYCLGSTWRYQPSSGRGIVYSHTTVHRGPDATWDVPYVLGIVDMDEQWSLLTRLLVPPPPDDPPGALIGRRVQVSFTDAHPPSPRRLPSFELADPSVDRGANERPSK